MAYPFVQLPTFEQFINKVTAKPFECTFETVEAPMMIDGDDNDCVSINFFKRIVDGEAFTYAIFIDDFEARMAPSVVRSICARLHIPTEVFGLTLG